MILFGLRPTFASKVIAWLIFFRQVFSCGYVGVPFLGELLDHGVIANLTFENSDDLCSYVAIVPSLCLEGILLQIVNLDAFVQFVDLSF